MTTNGKLPHGEERPPMEPMPQTGVYPLEKFCLWFEFDRDEMIRRLGLIGVEIDDNGCVDMEKVIEGIERTKDLPGESDGEEES